MSCEGVRNYTTARALMAALPISNSDSVFTGKAQRCESHTHKRDRNSFTCTRGKKYHTHMHMHVHMHVHVHMHAALQTQVSFLSDVFGKKMKAPRTAVSCTHTHTHTHTLTHSHHTHHTHTLTHTDTNPHTHSRTHTHTDNHTHIQPQTHTHKHTHTHTHTHTAFCVFHPISGALSSDPNKAASVVAMLPARKPQLRGNDRARGHSADPGLGYTVIARV